MEAKRIASLIESFGVNTFSSPDDSNMWGSWPANYSPASVIAALQYILGDSGFAFRLREYHYNGREAMQRPWLREIVAAIPGTEVALCVGANGSTNDVPTMLDLASDPGCAVQWVEGLNEPNTNFGSGEVPAEDTLAIQQAMVGAPCVKMGPSIVAGTPHPEGWITGYAGDTLAALNRLMDWGNGHCYPPGCPDVPSTGYSINEYIGGLWTAYAEHPIALTEFHPTLYNSEGHKPDEQDWDGKRDSYYTLMTLLRCAKNGTMGVWWYALFDYGTTYRCGLFPQLGANDPRPAADDLQSLCAICADRGDRRNFPTTSLDLTVNGLTEAIDYDVYQASDGRFLVPLWYAATERGDGPTIAIDIGFDTPKSSVRIYDPLQGPLAIDRDSDVSEVKLQMLPGVVLLEIRP